MKTSLSASSIIMASLFLPLSCIVSNVTASPIVVIPQNANADIAPQTTATTASPTSTIEPACTTLTRFEGFKVGPTSTVFATTSTKTITVDCGPGCNRVAVDKAAFGRGPVAIFKTTVTVQKATTTTTFACKATTKA